MYRVKVTTRACFYSQIAREPVIDSLDTVGIEHGLIVRNVSELEILNLVNYLNAHRTDPRGGFFKSKANPTDHDYVDYYIKYRNPSAP